MGSRLTRPMVVGPFRPAIRTGPAVERVFSSAAASELAASELAALLDAASEAVASDDAVTLEEVPPQAARPSSMAADKSREASFFMVGKSLLCKIFSKCHKTICFAAIILL